MQLNIGGVVLMIASNPNDDNDDNGDNDDDETDTNWLDSYIRKYRNLIKNKNNSSTNPYDFTFYNSSKSNDIHYNGFDDIYNNRHLKKILTIELDMSEKEAIRKVIELLQALLVDEVDVCEMDEPYEYEGFDETFKDEWA